MACDAVAVSSEMHLSSPLKKACRLCFSITIHAEFPDMLKHNLRKTAICAFFNGLLGKATVPLDAAGASPDDRWFPDRLSR